MEKKVKKLSAAEEFDVKVLLRHASAAANKLIQGPAVPAPVHIHQQAHDIRSCVEKALELISSEKADVG